LLSVLSRDTSRAVTVGIAAASHAKATNVPRASVRIEAREVLNRDITTARGIGLYNKAPSTAGRAFTLSIRGVNAKEAGTLEKGR
jgi:hypothetical protein